MNGKEMGIMGKDGIGIGNAQRLRSPVWVCSFHEVRFSRKLWIVQGQRKSVKKKRPYVARGRCATQGLILLLLSGCQRMQLFAPIRMREILNDKNVIGKTKYSPGGNFSYRAPPTTFPSNLILPHYHFSFNF